MFFIKKDNKKLFFFLVESHNQCTPEEFQRLHTQIQELNKTLNNFKDGKDGLQTVLSKVNSLTTAVSNLHYSYFLILKERVDFVGFFWKSNVSGIYFLLVLWKKLSFSWRKKITYASFCGNIISEEILALKAFLYNKYENISMLLWNNVNKIHKNFVIFPSFRENRIVAHNYF